MSVGDIERKRTRRVCYVVERRVRGTWTLFDLAEVGDLFTDDEAREHAAATVKTLREVSPNESFRAVREVIANSRTTEEIA